MTEPKRRAHRIIRGWLLLALALPATAGAAGRPFAWMDWEPQVQTEAPSENPASPALLDRAEFPTRFAVALDQPIGDGDAGRALTVRSTARTFAALFGGAPSSHPPESGRWDGLSRVGLGATLGGPTQADDMPRALRPRAVTNHFTGELKLMLIGDTLGGADASAAATRGPLRALDLNFTADTYATGFGRDLYAAACIAETRRPRGLLVNLAVHREESIHERARRELKAGAGFDWRCFGALGRPVIATLSCEELYRNLGRHRVAEANAKCDVPLTDQVRLTTAVTYADRPERYAEGTVRGSLGFGVMFR